MAKSLSRLRLLFLLICCNFFDAESLQFRMSGFDQNSKIIYHGDAALSDGNIELNKHQFLFSNGWATYPDPLRLWDSKTRKLTDFTSRFSFTIDTSESNNEYGDGIMFFLAPADFTTPQNSAGLFLGLFNVTTAGHSQIVLVKFDARPNQPWDPPNEHVGICVNSLNTVASTPWNATLHSGDPADVLVSYDSTTKILNVSWTYRQTSTKGNSSVFHRVDLREVLPESVMIGIAGSTGLWKEKHTLHSWEFNSTLEDSNGMSSTKTKMIIGITVSAGLLIVGTVIGFVVLWRQKQKRKQMPEQLKTASIDEDIQRTAGPKKFSYKELAVATNNFSVDRKLGEGGFGAVYKGYLMDLDVFIAVKKIFRGSKQGKREYITEVKIISSLRHRNLVQLIGWCHESDEFSLVYEFMPNGSLDAHLFGKKTHLSWAARYKIALGLASALFYLHEEWEQCVVHRDIKSSNVMLDSNFNVKLGDFGLARLMDHELGPQTTGLAGTFGYMAPEYLSMGKASKETDVFSFGVVALEIATGRKAVDRYDEKFHKGLVEWVWDLYGSQELLSAVDATLHQEIVEEQAKCLMIVGLWCAHPDYNARPSIRQALQVLHFEAPLPDIPAKMPVPLYHVPTPSVSSAEMSITHSLVHVGR